MDLTSPRSPGGQPSRSAKFRGGMDGRHGKHSTHVILMLAIINVWFSGEYDC